jgi:hypothetical protein
VLTDIREAARTYSVAAINALAEIVENTKAPPAARVAAANSLLDRGFGKPESKIDATIIRHAAIRAPEICKTTEEWLEKYAPPHLKAQ